MAWAGTGVDASDLQNFRKVYTSRAGDNPPIPAHPGDGRDPGKSFSLLGNSPDVRRHALCQRRVLPGSGFRRDERLRGEGYRTRSVVIWNGRTSSATALSASDSASPASSSVLLSDTAATFGPKLNRTGPRTPSLS